MGRLRSFETQCLKADDKVDTVKTDVNYLHPVISCSFSMMLSDTSQAGVGQLQILRMNSEIRQFVCQKRVAGQTVGLVPTMGGLHAGHLSLVETCQRECDTTMVTLFVNPLQFSAGEDLENYPGEEATDIEKLADWGVDFVFVPTPEAMYPPGFSTFVTPPAVAQPLEGRCRPQHFRGVTTIVLKLFNIIPANTAYFGQKDYQQSLVIRQMVTDLNVPIQISVQPTVRDVDGLALSSRNAYLSADQRQQALALVNSLRMAAEVVKNGQWEAPMVVAKMRQILADVGISRIDYITIVHPETLEEIHHIQERSLAAVAAYVGNVRLIDNQLIDP